MRKILQDPDYVPYTPEKSGMLLLMEDYTIICGLYFGTGDI